MKAIIYILIGIIGYQFCIIVRNPKLASDCKEWAHRNAKSECTSELVSIFGNSFIDTIKNLIVFFRFL